MRKRYPSFRVTFGVSFSFFAVLGLLVCTDRDGVSFMCAAVFLIHELAHLAVMLIERKPPRRIELYGGGIHIIGGSTDLIAVSAGVAVNILLFLIFGLVPWENGRIRLFGAVNLIAAAFNLLPLGELDGKLMLDKAIIYAFPADKAVIVSEICEKLTLALIIPAVISLVSAGILNFSAVIFLIYIFAVEIPEKI